MKEEDKHKTTAHFFHTYDRRIFSSLRSPLGKSAFITHRPLKRVQTKKPINNTDLFKILYNKQLVKLQKNNKLNSTFSQLAKREN